MSRVLAHRGLSSERPENTLAAFRAAREAGFDGVELDVRLTHDQEVVCLHDASIDRTTDGNGRVADMDYDELRSHDTGAGPVPRLDDVLADLAAWPAFWNVELKARRAAVPVVHLLHQHGVLERAVVSSFDPAALRAVRAEDDAVALGLIVPLPPDVEDLGAAKELGCTWVNVEHSVLTRALVDSLHADGHRVGAWTVNDPERARALDSIGVDLVMSDVRAVRTALRPASVA